MALSTHQKFDISKQLAIAVIHKTFPSQKIEEALRETGKGSKRKRDLPSQVMVYKHKEYLQKGSLRMTVIVTWLSIFQILEKWLVFLLPKVGLARGVFVIS